LQRSTLAAVEWALRGSGFLRVHRRFLVNMARVRAISATGARGLQLTLCDGSTVPVSRRYQDRVRGHCQPKRSDAGFAPLQPRVSGSNHRSSKKT
jgi:DNA-binding LytR/AlgR family response regulator